jgi:hypothetical protein
MLFIAIVSIKSAALVVLASSSNHSMDQTSVQAGRSSDGLQCTQRDQLAKHLFLKTHMIMLNTLVPWCGYLCLI